MRFSSFSTVWYSLSSSASRGSGSSARAGAPSRRGRSRRARRERSLFIGLLLRRRRRRHPSPGRHACSGRRPRRRERSSGGSRGCQACSATAPGRRSRSSKCGLWVSTAYGPGAAKKPLSTCGRSSRKTDWAPASEARLARPRRPARAWTTLPSDGHETVWGSSVALRTLTRPADRDREPARLEPRLELVRADRELDPLAAARARPRARRPRSPAASSRRAACRAAADRRSWGRSRRASSRRRAARAAGRRRPFPGRVSARAASMHRRDTAAASAVQPRRCVRVACPRIGKPGNLTGRRPAFSARVGLGDQPVAERAHRHAGGAGSTDRARSAFAAAARTCRPHAFVSRDAGPRPPAGSRRATPPCRAAPTGAAAAPAPWR